MDELKPLTPPGAHPALMAASDYGLACNLMARHKLGTPEYDAAYRQCNEAWERIAAACGVAPTGGLDLADVPVPRENSWQRPSKEWYAEKIADTQQAEDAAGGVLAAGALGVTVAGHPTFPQETPPIPEEPQSPTTTGGEKEHNGEQR